MRRMTTTCMLPTLLLLMTSSLAASDAGETTLYVFQAEWCQPCQKQQPSLNLLQKEGMSVRIIDIDHDPDFANRYHVTAVPTFVLIANGQEVTRETGFLPEKELRRLVSKSLDALPKKVTGTPLRNKNPEATQPAEGAIFPVQLRFQFTISGDLRLGPTVEGN